MKNRTRKFYQRKFNKHIHILNKNITEDNLWQGRFIFLQKDAHFWKFSDNSGGELIVFVRGYDKKTGYYKDYRIEFAPWLQTSAFKLWGIANDFIVNGSGVWEQSERPSIKTAEDFTKVKVDIEDLMRKPLNFYVSYKYWEGGNNIW